MFSRLQRDEALEKEDRIDEMKKHNSPPVPHLLQAQQAPALPYAKVVGRPGTGSYPAPSPDPTTHFHVCTWMFVLGCLPPYEHVWVCLSVRAYVSECIVCARKHATVRVCACASA